MNEAERTAWISLPIVILVALGVALAGSQGSESIFGVPMFGLAVAVIFAIQWVVFVAAYLMKSEKFFDLTGSLTYIAVIIAAVLLSENMDSRSIMLMILVVVWAGRLGSFLFRRVMKAGEDARFDELKVSFPRFLMTWTLQGLWVTMTLAAALAAVTTSHEQPLGIFAITGLVVWLVGFIFEVVADGQKSRFKANPENEGKFINSGLWAWSRHPNYFGEIVLWLGVAIVAIPVLQGWQWVTMISPVFVALLLTRISGIPILQKRGDEKWGGQADYEAYKANTPVLIPKPPKRG